jgi:hypothetical protein
VSAPSIAITSLLRTRTTWRVALAAWLALAVAVPQASAPDPTKADARSHTHIDLVSTDDTLVATVRAKQSSDWNGGATWVCAGNPFAFVTPSLNASLLDGPGTAGCLPTRSVLQHAARPPPHA